MKQIHFCYILCVSLCFYACGEKAPEDISKNMYSRNTQPVAQEPPPTPYHGDRLVLLGSGTPIPSIDSSGPASAIISGETAFLVDAGAGVTHQALRAYHEGHRELHPSLLRYVFITHLHSDHTMGLPDVIFTPWIIGKSNSTTIVGPPGTKKMVTNILAAWQIDLDIRQLGKPAHTHLENMLTVKEVRSGVVFQQNGITVEAIPVKHGAFEHPLGYKFSTPTKTFVISGDTVPSDNIVSACKGCDVLLHEVYSYHAFQQGPANWREYHKSYHTSTVDLGRLASRAKPKRLVLYHKLLFGVSEEALVREVEAHFDGNVECGEDLGVYR